MGAVLGAPSSAGPRKYNMVITTVSTHEARQSPVVLLLVSWFEPTLSSNVPIMWGANPHQPEFSGLPLS